MPTETMAPSAMARALRTANLPLATRLAASHPHTPLITQPVTATGLTPLHLGTILRDAELVRVLLHAGASPDARALLLAAQQRTPQVLGVLLAASPHHVVAAASEAVHAAAWAGSLDCLRLLVHARVSPEWRGEDGATALCCAVLAADLPMVQCLLHGGARVRGLTVRRVSLEHWARRAGTRIHQLVAAAAHAEDARQMPQSPQRTPALPAHHRFSCEDQDDDVDRPEDVALLDGHGLCDDR